MVVVFFLYRGIELVGGVADFIFFVETRWHKYIKFQLIALMGEHLTFAGFFPFFSILLFCFYLLPLQRYSGSCY